MDKREFLNSNQEVIKYFIRLMHKLTPAYLPTLLVQSLMKTIRPLLFIMGPKLIVDELMGLQRTDRLVLLIAIIALGNFVVGVTEKVLKSKTDLLTYKFNNAFERHIAKKTVEIDFENVEDPEILNLKERALFAVRNHGLMYGMVEGLSKIANEMILIVSLSAIIWTFSPWVLLLLIGVVMINSFLFKKIQKYYYRESTNTVNANRAFVYYINQSGDQELAKDIRLYNMPKMIIDKMNRVNLATYDEYLKIYGTISRLDGLVSVNVQIQTVIIYILLAAKAVGGTVTIGNFMMYAGTIGKYSQSMNNFVSGIIEVNRLCRQLELLVEYEKIPASKDSGDQAMPDGNLFEIEFHDVSFKYPRAEDFTLKNISVKIHPGEKISIIGLNGAGKTTFVKLLTRLYKPTEGKITLNGVDINDVDYNAYMSNIAAVFQDYRLFGISVEENITGKNTLDFETGGKNGESDDNGDASVVSAEGDKNAAAAEGAEREIYGILEKVGVASDIAALPNGLKTTLDKRFDRGATKLSGGQAQKVAIARALCKDAPIVVLDEPTAALDPIAEHDVYCRFDQMVQNKTAIYISHRLSSCRFCDRILVFDKGRIIEVGSHDELIIQEGSQYERMFNAQATYYSA
ncbi:ABC transporter ATP-binding protein [Fusibacter bizertensis]|uniref:ABC transporter ATP-binding protein n=1 Tax=Fusibacter bizertensis TaxID=1488331 RepID=A0ABT6N9D6_9FIRM|nr:ABC transporter ATP-binding protein [Fusibacter bizertensis]MDH8677027.1 ABC transporter ATP-binding protein [Fusibacter bizertensis]